MNLNSKKSFLLCSIGFLMVLFMINYFALNSFYESIFLALNKALFEPVLYWTICVVICSVILVGLRDSIYQLWLKRIFSWYFPLGLVITFLTDASLSYAFPDRLGIATILGWGLVVLTVIFVFVHLVLDRKKQRNK